MVNKSNTVNVSCSDDQCPAAFVCLLLPKGYKMTHSVLKWKQKQNWLCVKFLKVCFSCSLLQMRDRPFPALWLMIWAALLPHWLVNVKRLCPPTPASQCCSHSTYLYATPMVLCLTVLLRTTSSSINAWAAKVRAHGKSLDLWGCAHITPFIASTPKNTILSSVLEVFDLSFLSMSTKYKDAHQSSTPVFLTSSGSLKHLSRWIHSNTYSSIQIAIFIQDTSIQRQIILHIKSCHVLMYDL